MSMPRVLLVPTHRTGLANAVAAAARRDRHRPRAAGPLPPSRPAGPGCRLGPLGGRGLCRPRPLRRRGSLGLYEVATRGADLSLLSTDWGVLDRPAGRPSGARPMSPALLDCPVVLWSTAAVGHRVRAAHRGLQGAPRRHQPCRRDAHRGRRPRALELVRPMFSPAEASLSSAACSTGDGPGWEHPAARAWGLPLEPALLEAVARQVDVGGLVTLAGQRGFLPSQNWLTDRGTEGPLVVVAGGTGLHALEPRLHRGPAAAGAQVRRLDLLEDAALPEEPPA